MGSDQLRYLDGQEFFHRLRCEERNPDDATFQELSFGFVQARVFGQGGQMLLQLVRDGMHHGYSPLDLSIRRKEIRPMIRSYQDGGTPSTVWYLEQTQGNVMFA